MKRYKIEIGKSWLNIVHDEEGDWVKWEDVKPLLLKLEAQRDDLMPDSQAIEKWDSNKHGTGPLTGDY